MRKALFLVAVLVIVCASYADAQSFLNGSFEQTHITWDSVNMENEAFDANMEYCTAFGTDGNLDIIASGAYCGSSAPDGHWYVALTGGGSDAFSMRLNANLVAGAAYTMSFQDRYCLPYPNFTGNPVPIEIGVSRFSNSFGDLVYTTPALPTGSWTLRKFNFTAPGNGHFITVRLAYGTVLSAWVQVDNFRLGASTGLGEAPADGPPLSFYPNPAKDRIVIAKPEQFTSATVFDLLGKPVLTRDLSDAVTGSITIDLGGLSAGTYTLQLVARSGGVVRSKLAVVAE